MKFNGPHAFVSQPLLFLIVAICCSGSIGLGMVSVRNRNSRIANANLQRVKQIADLRRSISSVNAAIEVEQSFDTLRQRNQSMRIGLVPLSDPSVGVLDKSEDPIVGLALRASRESGDTGPVVNTVRLALGN